MKLTRFRTTPSLRTGRQSGAAAGRNHQGRITVRHQGGGHKQVHRQVDWNRTSGTGVLVGFEYDPRRSVRLAKVLHSDSSSRLPKKSSYSLIPAAKGRKLLSSTTILEKSTLVIEQNQSSKGKDPLSLCSEENGIFLLAASVKRQRPRYTAQGTVQLQPGDFGPLSAFEVGDFLHGVQPFPGQPTLFARSAGTFCQVRSSLSKLTTDIPFSANSRSTSEKKSDRDLLNSSPKEENVAILRLPSGSHRKVSLKAYASLGRLATPFFGSNVSEFHEESSSKGISSKGKAGRSRWLGIRPTVRGRARNPVDHPHGGNSFGRPSVTFKAWPTKGQPTRNVKRKSSRILTPRKK